MNRVLYLGLDPSRSKPATHYPVIRIVPRDMTLPDFSAFETIIVTSKSVASLIYAYITPAHLLVAVGKATQQALLPFKSIASQNETSEGVVELLKTLPLRTVLYLHSSKARNVILKFLQASGAHYHASPLYDTLPQCPLPIPNLDDFDEIIFTSPSTIDAFLAIFHRLPTNKQLTCIGPITRQYLEKTHFLIK